MLSFRMQVLVGLAALLLPLGLALALGLLLVQDTRHQMASAERAGLEQARLAAAHYETRLAEVEQTLRRLALHPDIYGLDAQRCDLVLFNVQTLSPLLADLAVVARGGHVICSAQPLPRMVAPSVRDLPGTGAAMDEAGLHVTEPLFEPVSQIWVVAASYPLRDANGRIVARVIGALSLDSLQSMLSVLTQDDDRVVALFSRNNVLLARAPKRVDPIDGQPHRGVFPANVGHDATAGTVAAEDIDGVDRLYGYREVPRAGWRVYAGAAGQPVLEKLLGGTYQAGLTYAGFALLLLLLTVWNAHYWVRDTVQVLKEVAGAAQWSGYTAAMALKPTGPREVVDAIRAINRSLAAGAHLRQELTERCRHEREVLDAMHAFVLLLAPDGRVLDINRTALQMTGLHREDVVGRNWVEQCLVGHSADEQDRIADTLRAVAGDEIRRLNLQLRVQQDGRMIEAAVTAAPLRDTTGQVVGVIVSGVDVSECLETQRKLRQTVELLRRLALRLDDVQEIEQRRLSAELHDCIGQKLAALSVNLRIIHDLLPAPAPEVLVQRLQNSAALLERTTAQVRNVIGDLRPMSLNEFGLLSTLRRWGERIRQRSGIEINVLGDSDTVDLTRATQSVFLRITQEALTNILKHARAQRVWIKLLQGERQVTLTVTDDGRGFNGGISGTREPHGHWGLAIMRERAEAIGGTVTVDSSPGAGTRVLISIERGK